MRARSEGSVDNSPMMQTKARTSSCSSPRLIAMASFRLLTSIFVSMLNFLRLIFCYRVFDWHLAAFATVFPHVVFAPVAPVFGALAFTAPRLQPDYFRLVHFTALDL